VLSSDPRDLRAAADRIHELHEAGDVDAAVAACDALERAAGDDLSDRVVRESVFTARFQRGVLATEAGDLDAAAAAYRAAAALPFDLADPDQSHELAMALLNVGICEGSVGDDEAALATYDDLVARLDGASDHPVTAEQVVRARVNRTVTLLQLDRAADAVAAAEALAAELPDDDPAAAEQRGMALRVLAAALRELGRLEDATVALAETEPLAAVDAGGARAQAAAAQAERAELLVALGRPDEAITVLETTRGRIAGDPEVATELRLVEADVLEAVGEHDRAAELRALA
jgi:tetratricopeptide (TPR) repeat protein